MSVSSVDFKKLFESVPGLYLVLTPDLTIAAVSDAFLRATRTRREDIVGRGMLDVFPDNPEDPTATGTRNLLASLERARLYREPDTMAIQKHDIRRPTQDGGGFEVRFWSPVNTPVLSARGELLYFIHRVEDVTDFVRLRERQNAQEQESISLRSQAERLASDIYQRSQEVAEANRQLTLNNAELQHARAQAEEQHQAAERASRGKSRFLAMASHDLRQPLQSLALISGILRQIITAPEASEALAQQDQAIASMSRLLNALLDISKLESGAIRPDPADFRVSRLFEQLRSEFTGVAAQKGLRMVVDDSDACAHSDPWLVEQVLRNLISNAIKYTEHGEVRLRCRLEPAGVCISVEDTGIGIPADQVQQIFDEFYQVGVPANASRNGYGLGLSIVQRLVRLLALDLQVRSEPGRGSVFTLTLPVGAGAAPVMRVALADTAPLTDSPRVLLVEDDPAVRRTTQMFLGMEGCRVSAAASLAEALAAAQAEPDIQLLVTDYHLGAGATGLDIVAALRRQLQRPLPALLITGDTSTAMQQIGRDPRLRIASKPIKVDEMRKLLRVLLSADD